MFKLFKNIYRELNKEVKYINVYSIKIWEQADWRPFQVVDKSKEEIDSIVDRIKSKDKRVVVGKSTIRNSCITAYNIKVTKKETK